MARKTNKQKKNYPKSNNRDNLKKPELKEEKGVPSPESAPTAADEDKAKNDPEWYNRDPDLLLTASNIPFSDVFGSPVPLIHPNGVSGVPGIAIHTEATQPNVSEPGIVVLETASFFGDSSNRSSPLNVCANALYTHVRYANSGRKNYDPADLAIYCITMADVYSFINWARRIYQCAFMYSQRNQYIGKALLEAQGWDADELIQNLVQFRYELNVFTNKVAAFAIPADIEIFKRKVFLYGSIYTESQEGNIKDQLYLFNPASFYRFELDSTSAGMLRSRSVSSFRTAGRLTMTSFRNMMSWFLNDMWNNEDFGLMSGDILKAFEGKIIGLDALPAEGGIIPVYDPMVLHQMKNATIVDVPIRAAEDPTDPNPLTATAYNLVKGSTSLTCYNLDVMQDIYGNLVSHAGYLVPMADGYAGAAITYSKDAVISLDTPVADPAMIVEATRLICTFDYASARDARNAVYGNVQAKVINVEAMTEIVVRVNVIAMAPDSTTFTLLSATSSVLAMNDSDTARLNAGRIRAISKCKYLPLIYGVTSMNYEENRSQWDLVGTDASIACFSDLLNYTVQSPEVIRRLNNVALMSLLYVPGVAKQINVIK